MGKFKNKVVLVTGSSRGIGASIAKDFAKEGANVIINYVKNEQAAEEVVAACIEVGGDAFSVQADVMEKEAVRQMINTIILEMGTVDIVVNNAFKPFKFDPENRKRAGEVMWEDYEEQLHGTVKSAVYVTEAVLPMMRKRGKGSIINMVTNLVANPIVPYHEYTTAKAALIGYSRNLAADIGAFGIRVNCVAPGLVYPTSSSQYTKEDVKNKIIEQTPLKRIATPADVAGPVLFLASDWSEFITGQTIYVDGGLVMR